MRRLSYTLEVALTVGRRAVRYEVKYPAAALAYYAFISQIPLLILIIAVINNQLVREIQRTTPDYLTPDAQQLLSEALGTGSGQLWAAVLAVGVLAWSWLNIVSGFQTVVNRVEHTSKKPLRARFHDASSIIGSLALVVVAVILTNLVFARRKLAGSLIGGLKETQEMLDFCAEHGITSDVEMINIEDINNAYERMLKSDVKYRFVIDIDGSLKQKQ
jgi:membrane protein